MTNILYWNIRQFSIGLINQPGYAGAVAVPGIAGLTYGLAAQQRFGLITAVINAAQADIIAIVEVQTGANDQSDLATNSGGLQAASYLLRQLRIATPGAQWRMVPPLWLGARGDYVDLARAETVAVLYRGVTGNVSRYFTGPNVWTGGAGGVSADPVAGAVAPANYPPDFNAFIVPPVVPPVPARNIPPAPVVAPPGPGPLYRGGQPENQSAARIFYRRPSTKRQRGGVAYNPSRYGGYRPPYMTSFYEVDNTVMPVMQRNLTLFSVHSPPNQAGATELMRLLSLTPEIIAAPNAAVGEIKILCGDFNLNLLDALGAYSNVYAPVTGTGYQSLLPTAGVPPVDPGQLEAYKGYFGTHISSQPTLAGAQASRFLWSNPLPATLSYYPGYQYISEYASIDNILVNPAVAYPLTIMNMVTGSPFVATAAGVPPNAPIAPPLGATALATRFTGPPPGWPPNPTAANYVYATAVQRCSWPQYGRIYSTSDHFALVTTL